MSTFPKRSFTAAGIAGSETPEFSLRADQAETSLGRPLCIQIHGDFSLIYVQSRPREHREIRMSLLAELSRRNVFKVGAVYAIVAQLLIQIAAIPASTF